MNSTLVFLASLAMSLVLLALERFVGVGWDFHPDSVTYATNSTNTVNAILDEDLLLVFNNGYYFICHLLGESIIIITALNMVLFSQTNVLLYKLHNLSINKKLFSKSKNLLLLFLLLANPYRLHLSTTLLKDTVMIFLLVLCINASTLRMITLIPLMMLIRLASTLYITIFLNNRILWSLFLVVVIVFFSAPGMVIERMLEFNATEMQLRSFDSVPTFQDYGVPGIFLRSIIWPLLAITGLFALISPALVFFPVALGSIFNQMYTLISSQKICFHFPSLLVMALFAIMVTGYTAYIRYIYPVLAIMPILVAMQARTVKANKFVKIVNRNEETK